MSEISLPCPTTIPYIEHMKQRYLESFLTFTAHRPDKGIRWTYGEILRVESCLEFPSLRHYPTNCPTCEESCHAESCLRFTSPQPHAAPLLTHEPTWHLEPCLNFLSVQLQPCKKTNLEDRNGGEKLGRLFLICPRHRKRYLERMWNIFTLRVMLQFTAFDQSNTLNISRRLPYKVVLEVYISSALPSTLFNKWTNLDKLGMLRHCYRYPPGALQKTTFNIV